MYDQCILRAERGLGCSREEEKTMAMTNKADFDDPMRSIGADSTAMFDDWDSNPAEHAGSEALQAGSPVEDEEEEEEEEEDEDEDEDQDDREDEDGLPVIPRRVRFR
jgi:hypothetical protein